MNCHVLGAWALHFRSNIRISSYFISLRMSRYILWTYPILRKCLELYPYFGIKKFSVGNKSTWFFIWVYILWPLVFGYETVDNSQSIHTVGDSTGPKEERKRGCAIRSCSSLSEARLKLGRDRAMKGGTLCRVKTHFLAMTNTHVDWWLWVLDDIRWEQT